MNVDNNEFSQTVPADVFMSMPQWNSPVSGLDPENGSNMNFDPDLADPLLWASVSTVSTNNNAATSPEEILNSPDLATYFQTFDAIDGMD